VDRPLGATGYLLVVAFDVVLATCVVPLFGAFYAKTPRPNAALFAMIAGAATRVALEFTLPKDGYAIFPFKGEEFKDVGPAVSANFPTFFDVPADQMWDPATEQCQQRQFKDYTGVDSMTAFAVSIVVFCFVQFVERNGPMFTLPFGQVGYEKEITEDYIEKMPTDESGKTGILSSTD